MITLFFSFAVAATPAKSVTVCWGPNDARCFRVEGNELHQSLKGVEITKRKLEPKEEARVLTAINDFTTWLKSKKAELPLAKTNLCGSPFTSHANGAISNYCLDLAPKNDVSAREKALLDAFGKRK